MSLWSRTGALVPRWSAKPSRMIRKVRKPEVHERGLANMQRLAKMAKCLALANA